MIRRIFALIKLKPNLVQLVVGLVLLAAISGGYIGLGVWEAYISQPLLDLGVPGAIMPSS